MKKVLSMVLVAAMTMSLLAGCASNDTASASTDSSTTQAQADSVDTSDTSADSTDGAAASGETFKIGGIGPITGGAAVYGIAVMNAAQIAVDEINAAGGINGYQVEYNFQDDELDNEKSVNAYNNLKDWGMQILMGSVTSGCCVAVAAESAKDNMFQITPSGSSVDCITNPNVFQVCFTDPNQGIAAADYIKDNNVASKVAVIYDSSDVYSSGIYAKFAEEASAKGLEIVSAEAFTADNKTDFSVQLQKAQENGADLVFLPIYYTEASLILSQADKMGFDTKFFGCDGLDGILGVENFDASLAEGVMLLTPFAADATDDATVAFVTEYNKRFGENPNQFAADAYDAIYTIKAVLEAGNVTPSMSVSDICESAKSGMTSVSIDGLTGLAMTWSADGAVNKAPKAMEIKGGEYKLIQ
ncbi:MAG: ABC transporter substrate-binding protein [Lachnospiraceae bacterium]|nr:ABC transporter substrate-binding protein [Lachnospiraceae bacterium]